MTEKKCEDLVEEKMANTISNLREVWEAYQNADPNDDNYEEKQGDWDNYGLCFDYVVPGTFSDQDEGYWRYQICWGGPSIEFRFYASHPRYRPYRIEYWYMNWFDGAHRVLEGDNLKLLNEIWDWFAEIEMINHVYEKALEDDR